MSDQRLFNLIPKSANGNRSQISFTAGTLQSDSQKYELSELKKPYRIPKGLKTEIGQKKQTLVRPQSATVQKQPKFNPKDHGCCKLREDDSAYNEQCVNKKPPIPRANERPPLMRNHTNYVTSNQIEKNYQTKRQQKLEEKRDQKQCQKEKFLNTLHHKNYAQVPKFMHDRKLQEQEQFRQLQEQIQYEQELQQLQMYDPTKFRLRKSELKKRWDLIQIELAKLSHKQLKLLSKGDKEKKESLEKQIESIQQEIVRLNEYEKKHANTVQSYDQYKDKLKYKEQAKNLSNNFWHASPMTAMKH